ncbi:MAG: hypothetical protein ABI616_01660 [Pseudomonadota bacterium]
MSGSASGWDDERIHAFIDGELDASQAAQLERDTHSDPALAARVAQQRELRLRLQQQFDPVLDEVIPQRLQDALLTSSLAASVTPIGAGRITPVRRAWSYREWGALAATLIVGVLGSLLISPGSGLPIATRQGQLVATGSLDKALSARVGTDPMDDAAHIGISVRTQGGEYCRTFSLPAAAGLACRRNRHWNVDVLSRPASPASGAAYRQAASSISPAVITALERAGAGEPLSTDQERALIQSGWDAAP